MKIKLLTVVVVGLLAVAGLSTAHAATLDVRAASISAFTQTRCTPHVTAVVDDPTFLGFSYRAVTVTVPVACVGKEVRVTVHTRSGGVLASGAKTPDRAGPLTITTGEYATWWSTNYVFAITVGGWYVPSS